MCGGTFGERCVRLPWKGLSPRVRGNRAFLRWPARIYGSIPACAGEPVERRPDRARQRVYPRVCGGTADQYAGELDISGLSPRVRGNLSRSECGRFFFGSIPACAGEPAPAGYTDSDAEVYPRVCGGTSSPRAISTRLSGLSPRVRGNLVRCCADRDHQRSIPACAGEPEGRIRTYYVYKVYPRVCGGTYRLQSTYSMSMGLSPRVRGNRQPPTGRPTYPGSIPACAGEPVLVPTYNRTY